jgi:DNA-binding NtrC family response regulator
MSRDYRAVLMVDDNLGFTFALAGALASRGIALVPARSVMQARALLKAFKPNVGLLIINCRIHGVCALATRMVRDDRSLAVAGILSAQGQCDRCRHLLGELFQDPEDRLPRLVEQWVALIRNRLAPKPRPHLVASLRETIPDKTHD